VPPGLFFPKGGYPVMMDDELSREEKLFWAIDRILSKTAHFLLIFSALFLFFHTVHFIFHF
jgi:hypothetical protein